MPIISTKNLTKTYGSLEVLRDVSLCIQAGDSVAIKGPSGSGKSTLLHILGTLDSPTSGSIQVADQDPAGLDDEALSKFRNERIGFVFQDAHLLPQFSVLENTLLPVRAFRGVHQADQEHATQLLERVGLSERASHLPSQLSGGERQRAAIARSLMMKPSVLLCDEPTGSLDTKTAEQILALLVEAGISDDRALVMITHSETVASQMQRRLVLREGQCFEA